MQAAGEGVWVGLTGLLAWLQGACARMNEIPKWPSWGLCYGALLWPARGVTAGQACPQATRHQLYMHDLLACTACLQVEEVPPEMQVEDALAYLASLGIEGGPMHALHA